ncbi:hypothetical protein PN499_05795 [Kamptonema animale CS-326]|uniref:hypothetical protein n=1 Tax=Kamptonema animale TaxID=92934 RepID=UPI00232D9282|nr:hypothetical protein [Kamptonema animale]MDB9510689.1 hypothetical protein [Kamptonema animale CS-326]
MRSIYAQRKIISTIALLDWGGDRVNLPFYLLAGDDGRLVVNLSDRLTPDGRQDVHKRK